MAVLVLIMSAVYHVFKRETTTPKGLRVLFLGGIILVLTLFAGLRTRYNDTYIYLISYAKTPTNFSALFVDEFSISEVYFFQIWSFFVYNFISTNVNVFFFLSSIIFVVPAVLLIDKYSSNFLLSMILFLFGGMYLFSLAGLKQSMATGVIMIGLPLLFDKKYIKYSICCLLAMGFHTYSMFFFLLPLLGREKIFNKWTILISVIIIGGGIGLSYISSIVSRIIELLGKDVSGESLQAGSVNILRAMVFVVPFVLILLSHKRIDSEATAQEKVLIKVAIMSALFMVLSLLGNPILFGRIPQYFYIGIVIMLPYLIEKVFTRRDASTIMLIAGLLYTAYGVYSLYKDGAFAMDIFRLVWF